MTIVVKEAKSCLSDASTLPIIQALFHQVRQPSGVTLPQIVDLLNARIRTYVSITAMPHNQFSQTQQSHLHQRLYTEIQFLTCLYQSRLEKHCSS